MSLLLCLYVISGIKFYNKQNCERLNDIHREKAPSNKSPAPRKSTNMGILAVGTLNQLFIRGS